MSRHWTSEEKEYLSENWGNVSLTTLCKNLNRSENAIKVKVDRFGLGAFLESGEYITLHQLLMAVTGTKASDTYKMKSWVENRGLPVRKKRVGDCSFKVIYLDEFWKWAEQHRHFIDFSKMEPLILGKEPDWVTEQRKLDYKANALQRKDPWTKLEDSRLKALLKQNKYGFLELSNQLNRTAGAIQKRIYDLGLKERPIKANNHNPWSEKDIKISEDMIKNGYSYGNISKVVGRSEKAIRGLMYRIYKTENADKIRVILQEAKQ